MELKFNIGDKVKMVDSLDNIHINDFGLLAKYGEIIEIDDEIVSDEEMPYLVLFTFSSPDQITLWCEECQLELIED